jgi:hypothetical protein
LKHCPSNDKNCIETPESAAQPGEPEAPTPEAESDKAIVVTGKKKHRYTFNDGHEHGYHISHGNIENDKLVHLFDVNCPGNLVTDVSQITPPKGATPVHAHPDSYLPSGGVPGPGDNRGAEAANSKHAFMVTSPRAFIIEAYPGGTYRVRVIDGGPLNDTERSDLISNMQAWEKPGNAGSAGLAGNPASGNLQQKYCGK